jgi:hypothetical protein
MNTIRWRKRRSTSNAIRVAHRNTLIMPADPVEATIASMRPVMPGTRSPAKNRTTASSQTVTAMPRLSLANPNVILAIVARTTAASAHQTPVGWMLRGRGGAWPVGRRRRPDRRTPAAPGCADPTAPGGEGGGVGSIRPSCNQGDQPVHIALGYMP